MGKREFLILGRQGVWKGRGEETGGGGHLEIELDEGLVGVESAGEVVLDGIQLVFVSGAGIHEKTVNHLKGGDWRGGGSVRRWGIWQHPRGRGG